MKLVVQSDSRAWGGNEKWLMMVGEGLADRGHDVLVSCHRGGAVAERARAAGLRVTHARPSGDADLFHALGFARMLRLERPDALLLSAFKRSFWGGWAARRAGVPRIVERLGIERALPRRWKYIHAFRHYIDALIVNSRAIRETWLASAPWFPAGEVHVVLNGIRQAGSAAGAIREELGLEAGARLVVGVGRLEERKGFDILLRAFARAGGGSAHLAVAGTGPAAAELRALGAALGVAERVHWLGFRTDVEEVLAGADLFVLASRREGMANVMLEAMAAGCLVVATDVSGVMDALGPVAGRNQGGWIVPPDDADAMAAALGSALGADAATAAAMRRELAYRVSEWFSPERTVEETERVLLGSGVAG